jgi:hypothetical protein
MTWLWENSPASGTDLLVMLAIADNADDTGGNAWPSMRTLARKCRISERSVQRAIRSLQAAGLLMIEENAGRSGTHRFTVDMTKGRQLVTPDNLSPRQDDGGDTHVTGGVTPVSPEPSLNRPSPLTPAGAGGPCDPSNPTHGNCRGCGTTRRALTAKAAKASRKSPDWCMGCDQRTRQRENEAGAMIRCPVCHPLVVKASA